MRQQRSLESTLVGELARGAIVELATDAVEGAARVRISAPLEGWVTARLLEPLSSPEEPLIAPLSPPTEVDGPELDNGKVTDQFVKQSLEHLSSRNSSKKEWRINLNPSQRCSREGGDGRRPRHTERRAARARSAATCTASSTTC